MDDLLFMNTELVFIYMYVCKCLNVRKIKVRGYYDAMCTLEYHVLT